MIVRIDARRLTDPAGLHATLAEAFGFPPHYGKNLDALVDCLTHLDDPAAGMSRVQVFPGQVALLVIDHTEGATGSADQLADLLDAVAFVNWRRLEKGHPPVLAVAYDRRP
jgi:hypothetical protein